MIKAILFDFDGVIIDSYESNTACFRNALVYYKYSIPPEEKFKELLGLPVREGVKVLLPDATIQEVESIAQRVFVESDNAIPLIKLCNGVRQILKLFSKEYNLAIVSNRRKVSIFKVLDHLKINKYFDYIVGRENVKFPKPHPEPLLNALNYYNVDNTQTIYIGDREEDVLSAKAAKIPCVFISSSKEDYGAEYHISNILKLPLLIKKINEK